MLETKRRQAIRQAAELAAMERKVVSSVRPDMAALKERAMKELNRFNLQPTELVKLRVKIRDGLIASHILGMKRVKLLTGIVRPGTLQASVVSTVLRKFQHMNQHELDALVDKYEAETINVIAELTTRLSKGVRQALADAVESQVHPSAAVNTFFSKLGLTPDNAYFYETLLRTHTQIAYQSAQYEEYQNPDIADMIWGYQYITVGDNRVRPAHDAMNRTTLPKDDPFWKSNWPPNGWNCRCSVVPVFEDERSSFKVQRAPSWAEPDQGFGFNPADISLAL